MREPWQMTQREWIDGHIKSPAMHKEHVRIALSKGKLVSAEVLKEYPDLAKPVGGEQAGMLGVPGKYVEQKRPWTPGQMGFESYAKYVEAMGRKPEQQSRELTLTDYDKLYTFNELREICGERGIHSSGDKKALITKLLSQEIWDLDEIKSKIQALPPEQRKDILTKYPDLAME